MKFQSTDWLAEFLYHALDAGVMIEVQWSSGIDLTITVLEKVENLFKQRKKRRLMWYNPLLNGGSFAKNPKAKDNWALLTIDFDSDGNLLTLTICGWVGAYKGQQLDMDTQILELTPLEAYQEISQLALIDRPYLQ